MAFPVQIPYSWTYHPSEGSSSSPPVLAPPDAGVPPDAGMDTGAAEAKSEQADNASAESGGMCGQGLPLTCSFANIDTRYDDVERQCIKDLTSYGSGQQQAADICTQ
jgi:hypothetical protein